MAVNQSKVFAPPQLQALVGVALPGFVQRVLVAKRPEGGALKLVAESGEVVASTSIDVDETRALLVGDLAKFPNLRASLRAKLQEQFAAVGVALSPLTADAFTAQLPSAAVLKNALHPCTKEEQQALTPVPLHTAKRLYQPVQGSTKVYWLFARLQPFVHPSAVPLLVAARYNAPGCRLSVRLARRNHAEFSVAEVGALTDAGFKVVAGDDPYASIHVEVAATRLARALGAMMMTLPHFEVAQHGRVERVSVGH